jgi:hypothetical protein
MPVKLLAAFALGALACHLFWIRVVEHLIRQERERRGA